MALISSSVSYLSMACSWTRSIDKMVVTEIVFSLMMEYITGNIIPTSKLSAGRTDHPDMNAMHLRFAYLLSWIPLLPLQTNAPYNELISQSFLPSFLLIKIITSYILLPQLTPHTSGRDHLPAHFSLFNPLSPLASRHFDSPPLHTQASIYSPPS